MNGPSSSRPPAVDVPRKSNSYRFYALGFSSPRVCFLLNTGDSDCLRDVPVLYPERLEEQLDIQTIMFLKKNVVPDVNERVIWLPKICEVYKDDFATDGVNAASVCLRYCLSFLQDEMAEAIEKILSEELPYVIKFKSASDRYHTTLRMAESGDESRLLTIDSFTSFN